MVYLITDAVHLRTYGVMISDGLLVLIFYLVGYLAGIYQFVYALLDSFCATCYLFYQFDVAGIELVSFGCLEDTVHILYVLHQLALIVGSYRDDMVHAQVAHHTCLYLDNLGIGLPLHFVAGFQFLLGHHVEALKHLDAALVQITLEDYRT